MFVANTVKRPTLASRSLKGSRLWINQAQSRRVAEVRESVYGLNGFIPITKSEPAHD